MTNNSLFGNNYESDVIYKFCEVNKLKPQIQDILEDDMLFGEADASNMKSSKDAVNLIAVTKSLKKLQDSVGKIMRIDANMIQTILGNAQKNIQIANAMSNARQEKSKALTTYQNLMTTVLKVKPFGKKLSQPDYIAGNMILVGCVLFLVEMGAIISEATLELSKGTDTTYDLYVSSNKSYQHIFDQANTICDKLDNKIVTALYKECEIGFVSGDGIIPTKVEYGLRKMYGEAETSGILRVLKALVFKGFYLLLAPIRYIIYLFCYAGYSIADRMSQIKDTLNLFDSKASQHIPDDKMKYMVDMSSKTRVDRITTEAKVYTEIEKDRAETAKDVNAAISF